jgi:hypothetical protein
MDGLKITDEHAEFEAWITDADIGDLAFGRDGECYMDWDTQVAWRGWKARAAAQSGDNRPAWRDHPSALDTKALATAQEIALMWGRDRSQFVSRIQVAVREAMDWIRESVAAPVTAAPEQQAARRLSDRDILDVLGHYGALPLRDGSPEKIIRGREQVLILAIREILAASTAPA